MDQLTQKLRNGAMQVVEVPVPLLRPGCVLVRNHYSLVSAGTESSSVKTARMGLIGKARARPQQVGQVVRTLKRQGVVQTYRAVMKRLEAHSPLGYSCAGEVLDAAPDVAGFQVGELVACGGLTACHAEVVGVPANLCVKLSPSADLRHAAYNTLGAIALQGVRQADLRLGETCAVIGLGLLGQLTGLLLRASGVRVVGVDIDHSMVDLARQHSVDLGLLREDLGIEGRIEEFTCGLGCDAVIVTAASDSLDPINFAGAIARKRGTIVIVGAVPTGFDREPFFYRKELQIRMSCSYGPGRYDPVYEEKGVDYPPGYVRWTENRNMQAFQDLLLRKAVDVSFLTTHTFPLAEAPAAYDLMMSRSEPFIGILVEYDRAREVLRESVRLALRSREAHRKADAVCIGFIGAGAYAQGHLLPNLSRQPAVELKGVLTSTGTGSRSVADRFGFGFCTAREEDLLEDPEINAVFIATRHDSHAGYVRKALSARKHVFVEKPLCLSEEELDSICALYGDLHRSPKPAPHLTVGYNRRFSPLVTELKQSMGSGPLAALYRVNAGSIPRESWIQDPESGGGRIIGEVCHFVDLLLFLAGSRPHRVFASAMQTPQHLNDTLTVTLCFEDGSIGSIAYFANGDSGVPKERLEVFAHGTTAILDDFRVLTLHARGKKREKRLFSQDKGQSAQVLRFVESVRRGTGPIIPPEEIFLVSRITFRILESIRTGQAVSL
jgi:polar amino acid transport system substrate-binding protein